MSLSVFAVKNLWHKNGKNVDYVRYLVVHQGVK